jgi:sugar lactone lactonase YvrE
MGIAVNAEGTVYAADGMFSYTIAPGREPELAGTLFWGNYPGFLRGVAAAGAGEWVVTTANGTVARWTPGQEPETLAHGLAIPMGVAVAGKAVVVADAGAGRVLSVENGAVAELAAGLDRPYGVAVADGGAVYVSQPDAGRVVKLNGGRAETVLDGLGWPEGIAIRDGRLYVIETGAKQVTECDLAPGARRVRATGLPVGRPQGVPALRLGGVGDMCGPMWSFTGIAAAADGALYVSADAEGSVIALRRA